MNEFDVLVDKCAKRLAEGKKPHRVTLNKMHTYPGTTAEYRMKRLDERYKHFRNEYLTRQAELQEMFARAMSGTRNWETVGEPVEHDIKFIG